MIKLGLKGHFTLEKECSITGKREVVADFDNLILNQGLDKIGSASSVHLCNYVRVGTGTTAPAVTDTALTNQFASAGRYGSPNYTVVRDSLTGEIKNTMTYRFDIGVFDSTVLGEVGIGWDTASAASLFSKALILDEESEPTTITVLSTEYLYVTYSLSVFVPVEDFAGSFSVGATTYNYTGRCGLFNSSNLNCIYQAAGTKSGSVAGYSGVIGAITGSPSGTSYNSSGTFTSYNSGEYLLNIQVVFALGTVRSIQSIYFASFSDIRFQFELDNPIETTALQTLTLNLRVSWARV